MQTKLVEITRHNGVIDYKVHGDQNLAYTGLILALVDMVLEGSEGDQEKAKLETLAIINDVFDDFLNET